ncbi:Flavodoxin reductases (ferredoxin-NADPH reductases) family 1 [uncultured Rubrobacteraceae bacterium]|uniref:Flavodoxin reductases (Ferredoxin-NADPH reductases) family 1 n=1 Tax=uncultured Rubrobacteraceae bacterium TaxID=349277 RepID=A0A6J4QMS2_9ACTN|nr:Flavodoxin reductases (ferredoxin-NADPH reductases) family 1 [uncultured Rubrobacteraceae bacterium]
MKTVKSPAEGRVLFRNASWETYERLMAEREERPVPRFFYDRGVLEILRPSKKHETISRVVALLVELVATEEGLDVESSGSTTFKREDLGRGFEPDECFYFGDSAGRVRGMDDIDLDAGDPPPELVVEADLTSSSLDKLPIYARLGVAEVWRYASGRPEILVLSGEGYERTTHSRALSFLRDEDLGRFVEEGLRKERPEWVREVRRWTRSRGFRTGPEGE